ncbi:hypothetical protein D9615_002131 [Tricholomella constricta]|uniref:Protein kinase domain-containing protein n=1 Tax=Tricholomella constricta TaxID=117010 RepID=A0A8H5MAK2_9AGAR|nr:hypothetical protein D9615_002131 [Tricholomella constricta]
MSLDDILAEGLKVYEDDNEVEEDEEEDEENDVMEGLEGDEENKEDTEGIVDEEDGRDDVDEEDGQDDLGPDDESGEHLQSVSTIYTVELSPYRGRLLISPVNLAGDRGVYLAHDFGSSDLGCLQAKTVIVKAWAASDDSECVTERTVYDVLQGPTVAGIPDVLMSAYDSDCGVYAIVLQRLGSTVDDVMQALPDKKLDEKMVLAQLDRYKDIHAKGVIHNGMKPANICLPLSSPPGSDSSRHLHESSTLYAVDFGLSSLLCAHEKLPGGRKADTVGNRCFMSVFGHHGITQSQRDDLESLAYLLSFLSHGHLPWAPPPVLVQPRIKGKILPQPQPQLWRIKMSTPASILFEGMDSSFVDFWKDVKGLAFGESPDYDAMRQRFERCWERKSFGGRPGELDWGAVADRLGLGKRD